MAKVRKAFGVVVLGSLGFGLAWIGWHLYIDHQVFHVLVSIEQARQKAIQGGK